MNNRAWDYDDPICKNLYHEERGKLSPLPDADADFEALDNAIKRYSLEDNPRE